mgnify:CR=1 FL=1
MDVSGMNELSQGNTMLHQMREYNQGVVQHNQGVESEFNQKISDAQTGLRNMASDDDYAQKLTESIGGGVGLQAVKAGKGIYNAYKVASNETGFAELGTARKVAKVAGQTFADAPIGKAVKAVGGGLKSATGTVSDAITSATASEPAEAFTRATPTSGSFLDSVGARPTTGLASVPASEGDEEEDEPLFKSQEPTPPPEMSGTLGKQDEVSPAEPTEPAKPTLTDAAKDVPDDAPDAEGMFAKAGKYAEGAGSLAQGIGVIQGGVDLVKDISGGHVAGANHEEKTANILGVASGAMDLLGFVVPGAGLIGAGLGVASAVEGEVGKYDAAKKQITTTLPAEEQASMTKRAPGAGASAESAGQVSSAQTTAQSKVVSGGGASAF